MTISYKWIIEYLPIEVAPEKLSVILTSIGLEVESMEEFETIKGGLKDIVVGKVLTCEKHADADKLSITTVNIGNNEIVNIVCGAPNVAAGQTVIVAKLGATIYPSSGEPLTMKKVKIRGVESFGMICAEDELSLGNSHDGILIIDNKFEAGTPAKEVFNIYSDIIYEIGLTPNRSDAMSHLGVARDVAAYLSYHKNNNYEAKKPVFSLYKNTEPSPIKVKISNEKICSRYASAYITNVKVGESPTWLKNKLKAIGLRSINNIVDITNFILHETGQPLHAFDASKINGDIQIKTVKQDTLFSTLDDKEIKLNDEDIVITDDEKPLCIAGVYGGINSGVTLDTTNIFLESAIFNAKQIRRTSIRHGLRTDAAARFEKGVNEADTLWVLERAVALIEELSGGKLAAIIQDEYPVKKEQLFIKLTYKYLQKLSGKYYEKTKIEQILVALGFEKKEEDADGITWLIPMYKNDVHHAADIVEEIMRIDGLDNVVIPSSISIAPSMDALAFENGAKEKIANHLVGLGWQEIFTNSISNSQFYSDVEMATAVKMINNLSADLDVMRPSLLPTILQSAAFNINRKNTNLLFFEWGKVYANLEGKYNEVEELALFSTGLQSLKSWQNKPKNTDIYYLKGIVQNIFQQLGVKYNETINENCIEYKLGNNILIAKIGAVAANDLKKFDIKQTAFIAQIFWPVVVQQAKNIKTSYKELSKFPEVERDLAIVIDNNIEFNTVENIVKKIKIQKLKSTKLFDLFVSEKLGNNKKSMALRFTFVDNEKTFAEEEISQMMGKIRKSFEQELNALVRE